MAREIVLSASAMFLAIVLPQVLLLFIWKVQLVKVFEIFSFANAQHRFFEILAALIPLVILEAIIGVIFMMDSRLNSVLNRLTTVFVATAAAFGARTNGADTPLLKAEACVRTQFEKNGFDASKSEADVSGVRVSGDRNGSPHITVFLRRNSTPEIRIGGVDGRFALMPEHASLAPVERLTEALSAHCSKAADNRSPQATRGLLNPT